MRTLILIIAGLLILGLFLGVGQLLARKNAHAPQTAFVIFAGLWALIAGINLWIGVVEAGYGPLEELPIFLLILLVPTLPGYFLQGHLHKRAESSFRGRY